MSRAIGCRTVINQICNSVLAVHNINIQQKGAIFMNDNIAYNVTDTGRISINNMNFDVTNLHPKYSPADAEAAKSEIETRLFDIFKKYASGR